MTNNDKLRQIISHVQLLKDVANSMIDSEMYPVSFFSQAFDLIQKIQNDLHSLEADQVEMFAEQLKKHQALIFSIHQQMRNFSLQTQAMIQPALEANELTPVPPADVAPIEPAAPLEAPQSPPVSATPDDQPDDEAEAVPEQAIPVQETPASQPIQQPMPQSVPPEAPAPRPVPPPATPVTPRPVRPVPPEAATPQPARPVPPPVPPSTRPARPVPPEAPIARPIRPVPQDTQAPRPARPLPPEAATPQPTFVQPPDTLTVRPARPLPPETPSEAPPTINDVLEKKKISDLRKAFSLNDRFRYRKELFGGSEDAMNKVIMILNSKQSLNESLAFLAQKLHWDFDDPTVKDFVKIIEMRFI